MKWECLLGCDGDSENYEYYCLQINEMDNVNSFYFQQDGSSSKQNHFFQTGLVEKQIALT